MFCTSCGMPNPDENVFCVGCGQRLSEDVAISEKSNVASTGDTMACPLCGEINMIGFDFCTGCGCRLNEESSFVNESATSRSAPPSSLQAPLEIPSSAEPAVAAPFAETASASTSFRCAVKARAKGWRRIYAFCRRLQYARGG